MSTTSSRSRRRSTASSSSRLAPALVVLGLVAAAAPFALRTTVDGRPPAAAATAAASATDWRTDPDWYQGKAEWALYDSVRPIYGTPRTYETTIFTNKQEMDPATTTKSTGRGGVEVFKHNESAMIPVENYTYRFLTTAFVRTNDLRPYKVVASTQEDCGATYKQFVVGSNDVSATQFCYFPEGGEDRATYAPTSSLAFHDTLSLVLRDYDFERRPMMSLDLVADQTDTHETALRPSPATVKWVARETLALPYGTVEAHHLEVTHARDGGTTTTHYWFAADPELRHVMVKYRGPYGVTHELKALGWWAYWNQGAAAPRE